MRLLTGLLNELKDRDWASPLGRTDDAIGVVGCTPRVSEPLRRVPGGGVTMKRLIVCCDGTWNWPDQKGGPTNVVKTVRAILPSDSRGVPQVVSYDVGVGTGNILDRVAGGMFGVEIGRASCRERV